MVSVSGELSFRRFVRPGLPPARTARPTGHHLACGAAPPPVFGRQMAAFGQLPSLAREHTAAMRDHCATRVLPGLQEELARRPLVTISLPLGVQEA